MGDCIVGGSRHQRAVLGGVIMIVMLASSLAVAQSVAAQQNIRAIVCADSAAVAILRPQGDSVVAQSDVTLSGAVKQANQLEVYIDGALDSIVPLTMGAESYETTIHLTPGTRTVKIVAIDACQMENAAASVVVTYQPAVPESHGEQTPTRVGGGVLIGGEPLAVSTPAVNPLQRMFAVPLAMIAKNLDLMPISAVEQSPGLPQPTRLALVAAGMVAMTFSSALLGVEWIHRGLELMAARIGLRQSYASKLLLVALGMSMVAAAFLL